MKKPTITEAVVAATTTACTTTATDDATNMRGVISNLAYESSDTNSSSMLINLDIGSIDVNEAIDNVSLVWNKTSFSLLKQLLRVGVIIGLINLTLCQFLRRYFYKV